MIIENRNIAIYEVLVQGLVQGIGFRPFIYRLAKKYDIRGWVKNQNDGVKIMATGEDESLEKFIKELQSVPPPAMINKLTVKETFGKEQLQDFNILNSADNSEQVTLVSPDIAVCARCLEDIKSQAHRKGYPLVNCTHCGPRFTIVKNLPYDRKATTMQPFTMCPQCAAEYQDIGDRRFHAQPIACNYCGPRYQLHMAGRIEEDIDQIIKQSARLLREGKIIAMKGQGGYHLACNALDEKAVEKLRQIKQRDEKPFAVMFGSTDQLQSYVELSPLEIEILTSWQRPIVLVKQVLSLAKSINGGLAQLGVMLPYMPFHHLLFEKMSLPAIVLTSGNLSDNPTIIDDQLALQQFNKKADAVIKYNREIHNRADDSVIMVAHQKARMIRRSRGFAPLPVNVPVNVDGIIAVGAELNNCFCAGKGDQAYMSQHIGDLKNLHTYHFFADSLQRFIQLFRIKPTLIVHDKHPDYLSTRFAREYGLPLVSVQHHHAHLAACMAEYGLDEQVIGVIMDGTGYGDDGNIWGAEFFMGDLHSFERKYHFEYLPLPGGDKAVHEPWRTAVAVLWQILGESHLRKSDFRFLDKVTEEAFTMVLEMLRKNINCPLSSSAGRVFDAVAALLAICTKTTYHAEAPMRLENLATAETKAAYDFEIYNQQIILRPAFLQITEDLHRGVDPRVIATKFHNTLIELILSTVIKMRKQSSGNKVVLSGGLFQNKFILENIEPRLYAQGFEVFVPQKFPANDGGIALGQLLIAAKKRVLCV